MIDDCSTADESFVELQAILAGLPMHAIPHGDRSCGPEVFLSCRGPRKSQIDEGTCKRRVEAILSKAAREYPGHEHVLRQLEVEFASLDLVCFVDHRRRRLFAAVRGTDLSMNRWTTHEDMRSNMHLILGYNPPRAERALKEYLAVRSRFGRYVSFACGHSLGGAVVLFVARECEENPDTAFQRVDVFNTATSPLATPLVPFTTSTHFHRVKGDWASLALEQVELSHGQVHLHSPKESVPDKHVLLHFLPKKVDNADDQSCCLSESVDNRDCLSSTSISPPATCQEDGSAIQKVSKPAWWALLGSCALWPKGRNAWRCTWESKENPCSSGEALTLQLAKPTA
ncbi:unnamed protein product [Cladocopium goreaui]|uniref:Fungal lipase-like domain-containing protein n=1 Tax=Cladocopium goreaui TaxID=2562237 RepID=A0A9P1FEW6_9DINO|nr:unnamed protein product [Cladocopium goreaui]